jgi:hypothetical protein
MYVSVNVDPEEVLEELDDDVLRDILSKREKKTCHGQLIEDERYLLEQIWLHYRGKDAPYCLREYVWRVLGKVI